jgi:hypothetical protein
MSGTHLERRPKDASYLALRYELSHRCNHQHRGLTSTCSVQAEVFSMAGTLLSTSFDAGVPLRDVQEAASHADPRTTMRYDRARGSLDRHATYIVAAYLASAAR